MCKLINTLISYYLTIILLVSISEFCLFHFAELLLITRRMCMMCADGEINLLFNVRRIVAAASTENSITVPDVMAGRTTWQPGIRDKRRTGGDIQKESSF